MCLEEDAELEGILLPQGTMVQWESELVEVDCFTEEMTAHNTRSIEALKHKLDAADQACQGFSWTSPDAGVKDKDLRSPIAEFSIAIGKLRVCYGQKRGSASTMLDMECRYVSRPSMSTKRARL